MAYIDPPMKFLASISDEQLYELIDELVIASRSRWDATPTTTYSGQGVANKRKCMAYRKRKKSRRA